MEKSFYIPINSGSLAHYFSKAIIIPAKYFTKKPDDIQNSFADSILLSESMWVKNADCSIEVVLTDSEINDATRLSERFLLYDAPIPVSRVKSIFFLDAKQKETTIWNINSGAAFVPEQIVSVERNNDIAIITENDIIAGRDMRSISDLSDKIKRFDIILGGFAFMKLGGKPFMNFSENYFSTLSHFNKLIEEQTQYAARKKGFRFSNKYIGLFSKQESEWTKWQQYIYQNLDSHEIEALAEKEGVKFEKKLGLLKIDSIDPSSHLYDLAILATYGDRKNKSVDNLVTDLANGTIFSEKAEDVSILFGLNNGYSKLRNKYSNSFNECNVKFTLESKLDYYTIESIYQFVFNNSKPSYSFEYIDSWCPINKPNKNIKGYETYEILDAVVVAKKKQSLSEFFLENYSAEIYSTIFRSIKQWLPPFADAYEKDGIQYFEKLLHQTLTASVEALQKKFESEDNDTFSTQWAQASEGYQKAIDALSTEVSILKEENARLKKLTTHLPVTKAKNLEVPSAINIENANAGHDGDGISLVQESASSTNYSLLSITDLKKLGKQRGIPESTLKRYRKENKHELISLLNKTPEPPKIL